MKVSIGVWDAPRFDPATAGEAALGNHVTFGDGGEIDLVDLEAVRAVSRRCEVAFPGRACDVLIIDNIMVMHGRNPFIGPSGFGDHGLIALDGFWKDRHT